MTDRISSYDAMRQGLAKSTLFIKNPTRSSCARDRCFNEYSRRAALNA